MTAQIRINKYLADSGIATRREADTLIEKGYVFINGKKAELGQKVEIEKDTVEVKNAPKRTYRYYLYNKPRGVVTHSPSEKETGALDQLSQTYGLSGVYPIGRLDKNSEGLMLLTNDGRITERLLSPKNEHEKEYRVFVDKRVTNPFLKKLEKGVNIEGYRTKPTKTKRLTGNETGFTIILTEGKKHQIRRMCAALGYQVRSLTRMRIMDLTLKKLKPGQYRKLTQKETDHLLKELRLR